MRDGLNTIATQLISQVNTVYSAGYDLNGNTGALFFTGTDASDIAVDPGLLNDPSTLQAAGTAGAAGDNAVALALAKLATAKIGGLGNQTFNDAYGQQVVNLGNSLANANDQVANHEAVNNLLMSRRDSVSGVSLEEEMTSLISYQKAYQAAARIVTTVDQMLDDLLNMKR